MKTFALLLGVAVANNPHNYVDHLDMELAWKEDFVIDWDNLDHVASWENWKLEFNKEYDTLDEESHRFLIFLDNWQYINTFNLASEHSYTLGINQFADLTGDEFKQYIHGGADNCLTDRNGWERVTMDEYTPEIDAPDSVDWTNVDGKSYVTPVKNQGQCGSCWAFSTTGSIESASAIKNSETGTAIPELSEQQLVDCSISYGNLGCAGGLMDNAFKYVIANGGLCSETEYPYTARDGLCKASSCGTKYDPITSYKDVTADSMTALMDAVAMGPVSIAIEADQSAFQFYKTGVLDGLCGTSLDHGVLAVGYGTSGSQEYWKVKNSWGASWGMDGYVLICKDCGKNGKDGECGILMEPSYPVV